LKYTKKKVNAKKKATPSGQSNRKILRHKIERVDVLLCEMKHFRPSMDSKLLILLLFEESKKRPKEDCPFKRRDDESWQ